MLYILFGKDNIGKKTVREHFSKAYNLIVIPKYTDDKRKKWQAYISTDGMKTYCPFGKPVENEEGIISRQNEIREKYNDVDIHFCDANDMFLKYVFNGDVCPDDMEYEITKIYKEGTYKVKYYIKKAHIETALNDMTNDYILVCTSGKMISEIEERAKEICERENKIYEPNNNTRLKLIFVDGEDKKAENERKASKWETENTRGQEERSPGEYFFNNSYKFERITNRKMKGGKFSDICEMLDKQWEQIHIKENGFRCGAKKAFIVRPFSPNNEDEHLTCSGMAFNINEVFEKALQKYVNDIIPDVTWVKLEDYDGDIVTRITKAIDDSNLIFVDLRYHRVNCYYEYGYAKALATVRSKEVIALVGATAVNTELDKDMQKQMIDELKTNLALSEAVANVAFDVNHLFFYTYLLMNTHITRNGVESNIVIKNPPSSTYLTLDQHLNKYTPVKEFDQIKLWKN